MDDKEELAALRRMAELEAKAKGMPASKSITPGMNPTDDMGAWQRGFAGAGKAYVDIGRGAAQLLGADNQSAIDESKALDKPLMDTRGGTVGNVAGNIAAALPASLVPGANGVVGGAALGAGLGALQPTATGESRGQNMAIGAAGGGSVPLAGNLLRAGKSVIEPLYEGGRQKIMGRLLNRVTGDNAPAVQSRLANASELVPGSAPTAAEVAQSGGVAALQRAASAADPEAYATRAVQQNEARKAAIEALTGKPGERAKFEGVREMMSEPLYKQAYQTGIPKAVADANQPLIQNLTERMPAGVVERAKEIARIEGDTLTEAGSLKGMHYVKKAVDDLLDKSNLNSGVGQQMRRALTVFKNDLLTTMDELSPKYGEGRKAFTSWSKPINEMDVAQEIADKSVNKLTGQISPQAYARALSDDTPARATGFGGATLENTMKPGQLSELNAVKQDLARSVQARDLGRGPGSDTAQKLSMSNIGEQSGFPRLVDLASSLPGVARATNWVYRDSDQQIRSALAQALLDPKRAASLMTEAKGNPQLAKMLRETQRLAIPVGAALPLSQ